MFDYSYAEFPLVRKHKNVGLVSKANFGMIATQEYFCFFLFCLYNLYFSLSVVRVEGHIARSMYREIRNTKCGLEFMWKEKNYNSGACDFFSVLPSERQ